MSGSTSDWVGLMVGMGIERERAEAAASSSANIEDAVAMALSDDAIGGGAAAAGAAVEGDDDTEGGEKAPAHQVFVIDSDDDDVDDGITITGGTSRHKRSRGGGSSGSGSGKHKKVKKIEEKKARVFDLGEEMAGAGSHDSRKRLLRDLKRIKKSEELQMFKVEPARGGDDLYTWDLAFPSATFFESAPELFKDLLRYGEQFGKAEEVVMRIHFTPQFPTAPPFVRVIRPRFMFHTGHVTIGGSICTEVLTASGTAGSWQSTITMENLILLLHNLIGVDGAGRVDFGSAHHPTPEMDYSEGEARAAFQRVARFHGWKP
eukprot:gene8165-15493_t